MERDDKRLIQRLNRIEGQIRGIARMIEDGKYCVDVLDQIAAARAALNRVGIMLLESHTKGCFVNAVKGGSSEKAVDELMRVVMKFVK